ncbi:MAG: sigma-70 family RNA polymerase sigma factor, partial [Acidimicrobiales bacterium]|nr:sigma-70 family RNA polymerase sigma factor [Acidimicrobiales bacterium]
VAWRIVRNRDTAAEVAQDVFLAAWQGLGQLEQPGSFGGWVRRIARNRALNRLDRDRRATPAGGSADATPDRAAPEVDMTAAFGERDQRELVLAAASALGERDASLLDLHLRHGFGAQEIAEELDVTANNAHQLLHRLKRRLGGAIRSWVLWRDSSACAGLDRAITAAGITTFGPEAVRVVGRHAQGCDDCGERQRLRLAPEALFAAMPMVIAPPLIKAEAAAALGEAGVPMAGSASVGLGDAAGSTRDAHGGGGEPGANGEDAGAGAGADTGVPDGAAAEADTGEPGGVGAGGEDGGGEGVAAGAGGTGSGGVGMGTLARRLMVAVLVALVVGVGAVALLTRGAGDPDDVAEPAGSAVDAARSAGSLSGVERAPTTPTTSTLPAPVPPTAADTTAPADPAEPAGGGSPDAVPDPGSTGTTASTGSTTGREPADPGVPGGGAPAIGGFRASLGGACGATASDREVHLAWQSTGGDSATLSGPGGVTTHAASGTETRCVAAEPAPSFTLTVTGPGGEATATATAAG